jgi:hypothetical protein
VAKIQTDKQRKLVRLLSENLGLEKPKTLIQILLESGYSEESARQQSTILAGVREELAPIVKEMQDHRANVIKQMVIKMPKADYRALTDSLDKLTKNIQLLSGGATANIAAKVHISEEKRALVDIALSPLLDVKDPTANTE